MDRRDALRRIAEIVGPEGIVPPTEAERYLVDERRLYRGSAALIVRPSTVDECSRILAICNRARLGVVPQGGNTGYCGGATPFDAERHVLVVMTRMNRIREIDPVGFTLTAEAGVVLADAQAEAQDQMAEAQQDVMEAQQEGDSDAVADAAQEASETQAEGEHKISVAQAEATHRVAIEKCEALTGAAQEAVADTHLTLP
ncbi:MAG: FAD-binding protein, partial [Gammaproteobacteria bacterium]